MKLKAILLLSLLLVSETYCKCAIDQASLDFVQIKNCVSSYPKDFSTYIAKMSKSHNELKSSTEYFISGV